MVKNIVVVGAGGHCRVILSLLKYYKEFSVIGIADRDPASQGENISGSLIRFSWDDFNAIFQNGTVHASVAVGDNSTRAELFSRLRDTGFTIPTLMHPTAYRESDAVIGSGSIICMGAQIGTHVAVGENCVIYSGAILEHEVTVGDHSYISPGCSISGRVTIGRGCFIGIGSSIKEKIRIGDNATVGAGAVVIDDVPDNAVVAGVPARNIK